MFDDLVYPVDDLPLDEWNGEDGDNSVLAETGGRGVGLPTEEEAAAAATSEIRTLSAGAVLPVPLKRQIKLGTTGPDAYAVKRALSKAGYGPWEGWGTKPRLFGPYAVRNLKNFQRSRGLKVDGVYGLSTHRKLSPFFDNRGRYLMGQTKVLTTEDAKRQRIVAAAMHGYYNRYAIHYTQTALRMYGVRNRIRIPGIPRWEDCSSFSTWTYWHAGVPDPNGLGYNGYGFTGTLANHGKRVLGSPKPGDLALYGRYPYSHVTIYIGGGRCISHGSEIGPLLLNVWYRPVAQFRSYF